MKNWSVKKLGEVCEIVNGGTPKTGLPEYWDGEYLWLTPAEMGKRKSPYLGVTQRTISETGLRNSSARMLPPYSVILSSRAPIGYLVINELPMATNQGCKGLVPSDCMDYKFLYYYLSGSVDLLNSLGTGATFKELSGGKLKEIQVPLTPLPEQRRIVKILDEAFEAIEKAKENVERNLRNANQLFESYLNGILLKMKRDLKELRLGEVYDVRDGTHDSPKYQKDGYALITSKNLKKGKLDYQNIKYISEKDYLKISERSKVHKGDILFAMIGTIGKPVLVDIDPDFAIKNVALFKVPREQDGYFLKYFLGSGAVVDKMISEANGTTQKFVGLGYLRNFKIPLPPLPEQRTIVTRLDALSGETKKLETIYQRKLACLDELKKSLLQKAFAGEL